MTAKTPQSMPQPQGACAVHAALEHEHVERRMTSARDEWAACAPEVSWASC